MMVAGRQTFFNGYVRISGSYASLKNTDSIFPYSAERCRACLVCGIHFRFCCSRVESDYAISLAKAKIFSASKTCLLSSNNFAIQARCRASFKAPKPIAPQMILPLRSLPLSIISVPPMPRGGVALASAIISIWLLFCHWSAVSNSTPAAPVAKTMLAFSMALALALLSKASIGVRSTPKRASCRCRLVRHVPFYVQLSIRLRLPEPA